MISLKVKYLVKVFLATMAPDMHRISVLGYAVLAIKLNNSWVSVVQIYLLLIREGVALLQWWLRDPGSSRALWITHCLHIGHCMERKIMEEHMDEFMAKLCSGMH